MSCCWLTRRLRLSLRWPLNGLLTYFFVAPTGCYSTFFGSHGEEAQHGSAGSQCLVCPHLQRRQGEFGLGEKSCWATTDPSGLPQLPVSCLLPWVIVFLIPFYCLVPVSVAAEQRILLSAAALLMPSDRGELHSSNCGNMSFMISFMKSLLAGRQRKQQPCLLLHWEQLW